MPIVSVEFDLPLPNDFLKDHSRSEGKTRKFTYHGPDKLYLQIDKETGREVAGPITAEEKADGRPLPANAYFYEIDCVSDPLLCHLRGPIIDELQEEYTDEVFHPDSAVVEGYPRFSYNLPLMPTDIFDKMSVRIENGKPVYDSWSVAQKLLDRDTMLTWDDIREHRDRMLRNSDSALAEDMPESLKEQWKTYRQKLRDLPAVMQAANVPPSIAYYMFPEQPQ